MLVKSKISSLCALASMAIFSSFVPKAAIAACDCQVQAIQRCNLNFFDGRFPQYKTIDECYEGEVVNCLPLACDPDCPFPGPSDPKRMSSIKYFIGHSSYGYMHGIAEMNISQFS